MVSSIVKMAAQKVSSCPVMYTVYFLMHFICEFAVFAQGFMSGSCTLLYPSVVKMRTGETSTLHYTAVFAHSGLDQEDDSPGSLLRLESMDSGIAKLLNSSHDCKDDNCRKKVRVISPFHQIKEYHDTTDPTIFDLNLTTDTDTNNSVRAEMFRHCVEKALQNSDYVRRFDISVEVFGEFLGSTRVSASFNAGTNETRTFNDDARVVVMRDRRTERLNHIFVGVLTILIIVANLLMGCQINICVVKTVLRRPIGPLIGFISQFLFMPLVSALMAYLLFMRNSGQETALALGLFTAGCSPGGGASNFWTLLLEGNVDLSIAMTFFSTILALGMMPLWMFTIGQRFMTGYDGVHILIPYRNMAISLGVLVVPLVFGVLLRRYVPTSAAYVNKIVRPFLLLIICFIITFGTYANLYMFQLLTWQVCLAGLLLPWLGFSFGAIVSTVFRQSRENITAIAIETGVQNTGIAIMLLKLSFSDPQGDLGSVIPVIVAMFTPWPLLGALLWNCVAKWRRGEPVSLFRGTTNPALQDQEKNGECPVNQVLLVVGGDSTEVMVKKMSDSDGD